MNGRELTRFNTLKDIVERTYGLENDEILLKTRTRNIIKPRQILQYLTAKETRLSMHEIGALTRRNHATIINSCKTITNLIETEKGFKKEVDEILEKYNSTKDESPKIIKLLGQIEDDYLNEITPLIKILEERQSKRLLA